jgi:ABC-type iron transport system FetAB ATPase subunit
MRAENLCRDQLGPVSLQLAPDECVIVQGASGAGKTLLLRALADMDPTGGAVWLNGTARHDIPGHVWRGQVALLPAESQWWGELVREHFLREPTYELAAVGLDRDALTWSVSRLSSGERQRLSLVRLLINKPQVLLLDEPTANLDLENTRRVESLVRDYMRRTRAGTLWVSHDAQQTARMAQRVIRVAAGSLVEGHAV